MTLLHRALHQPLMTAAAAVTGGTWSELVQRVQGEGRKGRGWFGFVMATDTIVFGGTGDLYVLVTFWRQQQQQRSEI
jgi:hypothetical protein